MRGSLIGLINLV